MAELGFGYVIDPDITRKELEEYIITIGERRKLKDSPEVIEQLAELMAEGRMTIDYSENRAIYNLIQPFDSPDLEEKTLQVTISCRMETDEIDKMQKNLSKEEMKAARQLITKRTGLPDVMVGKLISTDFKAIAAISGFFL